MESGEIPSTIEHKHSILQIQPFQENNARHEKSETELPCRLLTMPGTDEENDSPKVKRDDVAYEEARILVSNIPFRYRNMDLTLLCSKHGTVTDAEVIFNERGSKGFGFVSFATSGEARIAVESLNGKIVEGRKLDVRQAFKRPHAIAKQVQAPSIFNGFPPLDLSTLLVQRQNLAKLMEMNRHLMNLQLSQLAPLLPPAQPGNDLHSLLLAQSLLFPSLFPSLAGLPSMGTVANPLLSAYDSLLPPYSVSPLFEAFSTPPPSPFISPAPLKRSFLGCLDIEEPKRSRF